MNFGKMISKHRGAIMGAAAILVVFFHAYWKSPFGIYNTIVNKYGNMAVDFFVFISGFSVVYTLDKNPDFYRYYTRRLERVLPPFYVAMLLRMIMMAIAGTLTAKWVLASFIPTGVWTRSTTNYWYVSASLGFYAIAPLFYFLIKKARAPRFMMFVLVFVTGVLMPYFVELSDKVTTRFPALIVGIAVAILQKRHDGKKECALDFLAILAICFFGIMYGKWKGISNVPVLNFVPSSERSKLYKDLITPLIIVFGAYALELIGRTPLRFVNSLLNRVGKYTLEIYLAHLIIHKFIDSLFHPAEPVLLALMLVFSYPFALVISWAGNRLLWLVKKLPILVHE